MGKLGDIDYRNGARERLAEALMLLRNERFGGCVYLAGRAVEGMLRAVIWKSDPEYSTGRKTLETGHDLRELFLLAGNLGAFGGTAPRNMVADSVQAIAKLWWNDMRFFPQKRIETRWVELGVVRRKTTFKKAASRYYDACATIIRECEVIWQR